MLKQLNDTINYIEEHLLDEKVIDEAMKRVSVSELHFKNVFFFLTGMSINEYVKNRRLSEANYDLSTCVTKLANCLCRSISGIIISILFIVDIGNCG